MGCLIPESESDVGSSPTLLNPASAGKHVDVVIEIGQDSGSTPLRSTKNIDELEYDW